MTWQRSSLERRYGGTRLIYLVSDHCIRTLYFGMAASTLLL